MEVSDQSHIAAALPWG